MKILIGVDDSVHSKAAVDFVRKLSWPAGSEVVVVSVVQPVTALYTEVYVPATVPVELDQDLVLAHRAVAADGAQALNSGALSATARVLHGDPRTALVEAAYAERADLLVVGSHGRTGLAKLFMGSVAQHVVTHAPCNVLVVKLPAA